MNASANVRAGKRRWAAALVAIVVAALFALGASAARGGGHAPIVEPLGRGDFPAGVSGP